MFEILVYYNILLILLLCFITIKICGVCLCLHLSYLFCIIIGVDSHQKLL